MKFERYYEKALFEAGEAALRVLHTMVDTETQVGNHKNIPISIFALYLYSLVPQLMQLEDEEASFEERAKKVHVLASCIKLMEQRDEEYGNETIAAVKAELANRPLKGNQMGFGHDPTYGKQIPAPFRTNDPA